MANVHATMTNSKGNTVSTVHHAQVEVMAETWNVRITTTLQKDGTYRVTVADRETGTIVHALAGQYPERIPQPERIVCQMQGATLAILDDTQRAYVQQELGNDYLRLKDIKMLRNRGIEIVQLQESK